MTWCRIECKLRENPKAVEVGRIARLVYIDAILYSAEHLTDGKIRRHALRFVSDVKDYPLSDEEGFPFQCDEDVARLLVDVGLWDEVEDGWVIHDYLDYQPSRQEVEAVKARKAEAGRRGGRASGTARRSKREASASQSVQAKPKQVVEANAKHVLHDPFNQTEASASQSVEPHVPIHVPIHVRNREKREVKPRHPFDWPDPDEPHNPPDGGPPHLSEKETDVPNSNTPKNGTKVPVPREAVQRVVDYYRSVHPRRGAHLKPGHTDWRTIEARLRDGFSSEDLCRAVDGNLIEPWHAERNAHSIAMVFRNAGKVEDFLQARGGPKPKVSESKFLQGIQMATQMVMGEAYAQDEMGGVRHRDGQAKSLLSERSDGPESVESILGGLLGDAPTL